MNKEEIQQLSDEELSSAFRKHNIRGIIISLALLALFLLIYYVPLGIDAGIMNTVFIVLIVLSAGFGLWYNLSKRKYFREFRRRRQGHR
jgi:preprotein translocase subunit SecD